MSEMQRDDDVLSHIADFEKKVQRRRKNQLLNLLARIIFFILIATLISTYFLSPLGHVKINNLIGNYYYTKEEVLAAGGLNSKKLLLTSDENQMARLLDENPRIKNAEVSWTPFYLNVSINEIVPIARDADNHAVLSNGVPYSNYLATYPSYDLTIEDLHLPTLLFPLTNDSYVVRFLENLKILAKAHYAAVDYIDITVSEEKTTSLYYGIYYQKPNSDEYLRIRTTLASMEQLYQEEVFARVITQEYGTLKFNEEKNIHYRDAVCFMNNKTLTCAKN